jgi:hypothetical protein
MTISKKEKAKQSSAMNLIERLKDIPRGTKLYSPAFGEVTFKKAAGNIIVVDDSCNIERVFHSNGRFYKDSECMLFPSRENRDWNTFNKFDINSIKPFDKVLVRDDDKSEWYCELYSHYRNNVPYYKYGCVSSAFHQCIPYNDDTKHLIGTKKDCPEYYKTWE